MVFCITADALVYRAVTTDEHLSFTLSIIDYVLVAVTLCLWAFFVVHEVRQYRNSESFLDHVKVRGGKSPERRSSLL